MPLMVHPIDPSSGRRPPWHFRGRCVGARRTECRAVGLRIHAGYFYLSLMDFSPPWTELGLQETRADWKASQLPFFIPRLIDESEDIRGVLIELFSHGSRRQKTEFCHASWIQHPDRPQFLFFLRFYLFMVCISSSSFVFLFFFFSLVNGKVQDKKKFPGSFPPCKKT